MRTLQILAAMIFATTLASAGEAAAPGPQAGVPELPDLDVLFIEQWPAYQGYIFGYPGNVPVLVEPGTGTQERPPRYFQTRQEYEAAVKTRPKDGETMTFTAHIANRGGAPAPASTYVFKVDDAVAKTGTLSPLKPGERTTVAIQWPSKPGRHFVAFEANAENKIQEITRANNARKDPTFGFVLTITAGKSGEFAAFSTTKNVVGSYSFEDWCQAHIDKWREHFAAAKYPSTPDGVTAGVRFNYIFPEDEGKELRAYQAKGGWLNWRIYVPQAQIRRDYAAHLDGGLIHELVHQCGVIDTYQIGMGALDNLARDPDTGHTIEIPYRDHRARHGSIMGGAHREESKGAFSEHEAGAFESIFKTWGTHAGFGVYLFDMPKSNVVQFLDNRGKPLAGAILHAWQQWCSPEEQNAFSRRTDITTPKQVRLDESGSFNLGANPYDTLWVVGGNCVLMFCVRAYGQKEYHFADMREINIACWRGDAERHTYVYRTNIAPLGSPEPPAKLAVLPEGSDRTHAKLRWEPSKTPIAKYRILANVDYLCALHEPTFEPLAEAGRDATEALVELPRGAEHAYLTVTAVAADGAESACAPPVVWPKMEQVRLGLVRPIGVAIGPDGALYVVDHHIGTIFAIDRKGDLRNFTDTALIGSGRVSGITLTQDNRIFAVGEHSGVTEVDATDGRIRRHFALAEAKGGTPGKPGRPYAIASDSTGRLYVSDRESKNVHICDANGKRLSAFDPGFGDPRGLAVAAQGGKLRLAVADSAKRCVWVAELDDASLRALGTETIEDARVPLCTAFDSAGRLYVGTQTGIDRFEAGKRTGHWQSEFNAKGHQVWGLAIRGDLVTCSEGSDNEKHWMKARLADFKPTQ